MNRHILTYLMIALTMFLSACQTDDFEPGSTHEVESEGQPLVLKVADGGLLTRGCVKSRTTYETDGYEMFYTYFEDGDTVGLFAIGREGQVMAKNVPYIYNESEDRWEYDEAESDPEKHRVYYDSEMSTYIIYYPYTVEVDEVTCLEDLKSNDVFKCPLNQSDKDAFRYYDLMVSVVNVDEIESKHEVYANLCHMRNCLMFDIETLWNIPNHGDLVYKTPLEAIENFFFYSASDGEMITDIDPENPNDYANLNSPWANDIIEERIPIEFACKFDDGYYRYILPDTFEGTFRWNYMYHRQTYVDEWLISQPAEDYDDGYLRTYTGCYFYKATHNMGEPTADKMQPGDLYCVSDGNPSVGFPLPWETRELLDENDIRCIGILVCAGRNVWDENEYPAFGEDSEENKVNGYVLSLTYLDDAYNHGISSWWNIPYEYFNVYPKDKVKQQKYKEEVEKNCPRIMDFPFGGYWNAYTVNQKVHNLSVSEEHPGYFQYYENSMFGKIKKYGEIWNDQEWDDYLAAPENSSGWLVPSKAFLEDNNDFIHGIYKERLSILRKIISGWQQAVESPSEYEQEIHLNYPYSNHIFLDAPPTTVFVENWWTCTEWYSDPANVLLYSDRGYACAFSYSNSDQDTYHENPDRKATFKVVRPALVF